jgi:hypothetical protein
MKRHHQVGESRQHQVASAVGSSVTVPKSRIDADLQLTGHVRISAPYEQVAGLLGDPCAIGIRGHPGQMDSAGVQFDEEQHVQPPQPDRVDGEEVAGDDPGGLLA